MTPTQPGRNDRCPCGSGKKYKHCCLQKEQDTDVARRRLRTAEGHVVDGTLALAAERWGNDLLLDAWDDFWNGKPPEDIVGTPEFEQMFLPWFVFSYVPVLLGDTPVDDADDATEADEPSDWPEQPLALEWLATQRPVGDALDRRYAETACRSPLSVFVVEQTVPGQSLDVRDVLTGARFHVLEAGASRTLRAADLLFASVLTIDGVSVMCGASHYVVPPDWHTRIIDWRENVRKRTWTRQDLEDDGIEIRDLYFQIRDALLNPTPPRLVNTDGDPVELTTLRFSLTVPVGEAYEHLLPLATISGDPHVSDVGHDARGVMTHVEMSWLKAGNRKHASWDNTILGRLVLDPGVLVAEVNSSKRANRLTREVRKRLGDDARLVDRSVHDLEADLRDRQQARARGTDVEPAGAEDQQNTPELQALSDEMMRRHWEAWLDERVPALGNKTPRQAARTTKGRERLLALLGEFDRRAESESAATGEALRDVRRRLKME
jgi:hypothetical protein